MGPYASLLAGLLWKLTLLLLILGLFGKSLYAEAATWTGTCNKIKALDRRFGTKELSELSELSALSVDRTLKEYPYNTTGMPMRLT